MRLPGVIGMVRATWCGVTGPGRADINCRPGGAWQQWQEFKRGAGKEGRAAISQESPYRAVMHMHSGGALPARIWIRVGFIRSLTTDDRQAYRLPRAAGLCRRAEPT